MKSKYSGGLQGTNAVAVRVLREQAGGLQEAGNRQ